MAALLLAHVAHYLWVMYVPAVLIVLYSIVKTTVEQRRERQDAEGPPS